MSLKNNINFKEGVFRRLMADAKITMDDLLAQAGDSVKQLTVGETVDGTVLSVKKHEILIDLGPLGVGLVPRREVSLSKNYNVGDSVIASVIDTELEDGYSLLSLRKAAKDRGWDEVMAKLESGEIITVVPYDANRGGLLVEYEGIRGFLPVSQLSAEHYPRVGSSDKDEILQRLNSLVKKDKKDSQGSSAQQQPNKQGADSKSGGRGEARSDVKTEDTKSSSVDKGPAHPSVKSDKDLPKTGPEDLAVSVFAAGTLAFLITAYYRSRYLA